MTVLSHYSLPLLLFFLSATQPVILFVLHHTFDKNYSSLSVNRDGVFTADFLCHEDAGLLICLANDKALKTISDRMISLAPSMPVEIEYIVDVNFFYLF